MICQGARSSAEALAACAAVQVSDDNDPPEENWPFWKPKLDEGERVSVFFRGAPTKEWRAGAHGLRHGLTRLMRFPHRFKTRLMIETT